VATRAGRLVRKLKVIGERGRRHRRLLFEHLPKCAGTSVSLYLARQYWPHHAFATEGGAPMESVSQFARMPERQRFQFRLISGHCAHHLRAVVHPDTVKVTILRDPIERLISHYFYVKRSPAHYLHHAVMESGMSLSDYVTSDLSDELRNYFVSQFSGLSWREAEQHPSEAVQRAHAVLRDEYAVVGTVSELGSAMERIRRLADISEPFPGVAHNETPERPSTSQVEPAALAAIQERNALDIELYERVRRDAQRIG
jgi:hypothetical protein